jgi:hypothetical protein
MLRQGVLDIPLDDNYAGKISEIQEKRKALYGGGETNEFLYDMDIGALYHYAGKYDSSNAYLMAAADVYDRLFTRSLGKEAAALLTNDNVRPYRGKHYEFTILLYFVAMNYAAMGDFENALVVSRFMQIYFNEWERTRSKAKKYHTDGMFHILASLAYERAGEEDNSHISLYKSVDAYRKGPIALAPEVGGFAYGRFAAGDRGEDIEELGIGPAPAKAGGKWGAEYGGAEIVVVGYAGKAPRMVEQNWYGTLTVGGRVIVRSDDGVSFEMGSPAIPDGPHMVMLRPKQAEAQTIKISLPKLVPSGTQTSYFTASVAGSPDVFKTVVLNDLDLQSKKALEEAWSGIVARTAVRTLIRTLMAEEAKKAANKIDNPYLKFGAKLAAGIVADQLEKADVRMCFLLPQKVIMARIPVEPGTHSVKLNIHDEAGSVIGEREFNGVAVRKGEKKVLICQSFL